MMPEQLAEPGADRPRILVVDDDIHVLEGMKRWLRLEFDVTVATSGKEAIRLVTSRERFAVVVTDLQMPGMDGNALLFCLRTAAPETVGILLTGNADLEAAIAAVNQGHAFRILTKPCPLATLRDAVEKAVQRHRQNLAGGAHAPAL